MAPLLDSAVELLAYGLKSNGVAVYRDYETTMPEVYVDADQLQQIVVNLIVNANQALQEVTGSRAIEIRTFVGSDGQARIVVDDSGPGVPAPIEAQIFDPFFTTKPLGVGTGIGLSISRGLAESQGGRLALVASMLGGAAFELTLPLASPDGSESQADPLQSSDALSGRDGGTLRAIIVDDEVEIAKLIAEALVRKGYRADLAASGAEAQALIAATGDYDAVICDLRMPDMDGPALFCWIRTHHPVLVEPMLFVTGDALGPAAGRFLAESSRPFLEKPFTPADVVRLIADFPRRVV